MHSLIHTPSFCLIALIVSLAEPFRGITTDGKIETGLFPMRATGVTTEPVRKAAVDFIAALTAEQRAKTLFPLGDDEWRKSHSRGSQGKRRRCDFFSGNKLKGGRRSNPRSPDTRMVLSQGVA